MSKEAEEHATTIVKKLVKEGFTAYFAGGWVRDHLLNHPSSDIDIATNAQPERILGLFPQTNLVGLAFGVVIVSIEGYHFEVSSFRRDISYSDGRRPESIEFSTPEEDAKRRDFTINGMFYDPLERVIHDFVHGTEDLKNGIIRAIGNPHERFLEDRLRMIRAVRFASRFDFHVEPETQQAIWENADSLLPAVAMERVWQEFCKMAEYPRLEASFIELHRLGLLSVIFPELQDVHLNEIKHRVSHFSHLPANAPIILNVMELFPEATKADCEELGQYLRASNQDVKIAETFVLCRNILKQEHVSSEQWVRFYALPYAGICLEVMAAHQPEQERMAFLRVHDDRREMLHAHIKRMEDKKPLLTAAHLRIHGILPGKAMGTLLKEAERIAILHDLHDPIAVVNLLQSTPYWSTAKEMQ